MAAPHIPSYTNAPPIAFTPVEQPTVSTLDGKVTWTWDEETGTLEQTLPDGGKLYLLAPDAEILYTLLHSVAARLATCSQEMHKRMAATHHRKINASRGTVIYLPAHHTYE
jgi:hypothetical protein